VLHTSGTTSRPKIVPLRQRNLAASARNIAATLALTPQDRCLVIMPLFHIHGLIGALLSSLLRRRQRALPAGLQCAEVLRLARPGEATWYSRGADHAPDHPRARRPQRRRDRAAQAALDPLVLGLAAAAGDEGSWRRPSAAR
jgi:hypothetical protein